MSTSSLRVFRAVFTVLAAWCAVQTAAHAAEPLTANDKLLIEQYILHYVQDAYVDTISTSTLLDGVIDGMMGKLDPHSSYMPPSAADDFTERLRGEFAGVGITFTMVNGKITVIEVLEGGPAEKAGVRTRDRIVAIDGDDAKNLSQDEIKNHLRGNAGTKVTVTIERPGSAAPMKPVITRDMVEMNSVSHSYMLSNTIGYVALTRFSQKSRADVAQALDKLSRQGMRMLVFDLRSNSGGILESAVGVANLFLREGRIVYTRGRRGADNRDWNADGKALYPDLPIVVMVNHGSASATEIVAGALQDHDRALIVGQTSFGKGLVMEPFPLVGDGGSTLGSLVLSVAHYYTPSGRLIQRPYTGSREEYINEGFDDVDPNAADSSKAGKPVFKTDLGRDVYGGGGITPDIMIPPAARLNELEQAIRSTNLCFEFADLYLQRHADVPKDFMVFRDSYRIPPDEIAAFGTFIRERGIKPDSLSTFDDEMVKLTAKYDIPDSSMRKMVKVLSSDRVLPGEDLFTKSGPFIEREIKQEIARMNWGAEERYRVWHLDDTELTAAVACFPREVELLAERIAIKKN
jgi:carboxyl-terminal processing protease